MKSNVNQCDFSRKLTLWAAICFVAVYSVNCFILSPIYSFLISDVILCDTVLPTLADILLDSLEILSISFCYASIIFCIYRFGAKRAVGLMITFAIATCLKYIANICVGWVMSGGLSEMWAMDIINILYYTILECAQLLIIFALSKFIIERSRCHEESGFDFTSRKIFQKGNGIINSALACAIVTAVVKSLGLFLDDLWIMIAYGAPQQLITVFKMLLNYASGLIFGIVCYVVIRAAMCIFFKKEKPVITE